MTGVVCCPENFTEKFLQNSNNFDRLRETVLFLSFGDKKVTQFSGFPPTLVSYLNPIQAGGGGAHYAPYRLFLAVLKRFAVGL